jgi:hypothetical protein
MTDLLWPLDIGRVLQPGLEHIGSQDAGRRQIQCWFSHHDRHRPSLKRFSTAQQFPVDLTDLFQNLAHSPVVGQPLMDLLIVSQRDIIHLRATAALAD